MSSAEKSQLPQQPQQQYPQQPVGPQAPPAQPAAPLSGEDFGLIIVALFFPFITMGIKRGFCGWEFWVNLLLTISLFFSIVAMVWSIYVVCKQPSGVPQNPEAYPQGPYGQVPQGQYPQGQYNQAPAQQPQQQVDQIVTQTEVPVEKPAQTPAEKPTATTLEGNAPPSY